MNKIILKETIKKRQNGKCKLSGNNLSDRVELFDTHRKNPKRNGGIYTMENTIVSDPVMHMIEHGNLRIRTGYLAELKKFIDAREQTIKFRNKVNNQLLAYKRHTDQLHEQTVNLLNNQANEADKVINDLTKDVSRVIKKISKEDPFVKSAIAVKGVGVITVAYCLSYIDLEKADHASSLWSYAGLHKASHERYEKGVTSGGNKTLRCILFNMAESQIKCKGAYRDVYDRTKARLEQSEKMVISRNTQGKKVEVMWKDTKPSHRHGAGLRAIMKHFLADYWMVGRTLSGLPTSALYPEAILGSGHKTIMPKERGWEY